MMTSIQSDDKAPSADSVVIVSVDKDGVVHRGIN